MQSIAFSFAFAIRRTVAAADAWPRHEYRTGAQQRMPQTVQKTAAGTTLLLTNTESPFFALGADLAVIGCHRRYRRT